MADYTEIYGVFTWTKGYTYLGDTQLATITPSGGGEAIEFNHPDRLGVKLKTDQSAGTSKEQAHLPFGTALNAESTVTDNNKRFTSYDRSPSTGLDYAINRTYDSKLGRFSQVDPMRMQSVSLGSPQTLNLYNYCGNDPINHVDPNGLFWGALFRAIARFFGFLMDNRRLIRAVVSVVIAAAPPEFRRIAGPLLGILGIERGSLGSSLIAAIGVDIGGSRVGLLSSILAGVGAIRNFFDGKKAPLGPIYSKLFEPAKNIILALLRDKNSSCYKFLKDVAKLDPEQLAKNLENHVPYDGIRSTNTGDFGNFDKKVSDFFKEKKAITGKYDRAATTEGNVRDTYYSRDGLKPSTILHETIHRTYSSNSVRQDGVIPALGDEDLGQKLGLPAGTASKDSTTIDEQLEKAGCK